MRVLVTGAAGFYGIHMVDLLLKGDDATKVIGVDNFSRGFLTDPFSQVDFRKELNENFVMLKQDFRELDAKTLNALDLDLVIHFAACVSIDESMEDPTKYFEINEMGTFELCQNLLKTKNQPYLIYASSPEVYGNPIYTPMDVNHPLYPRSVYAVTKLSAEKHCYALYQWYGYPVAVIRNFNTYGENQSTGGYSAVIPRFIINALKGKSLLVHWGGKQTRDFLYIKDAVQAYNLLICKRDECKGEIFNIGTGKQTSILELAEKIKELSNSSSEIVFQKGRAADLKCLEADISKTKDKLDWTPKYTLDQGLTRTIKWFKEVLNLKY